MKLISLMNLWKRTIVFFLALLANGMVSVLLGQEKSLSYYDQRPAEILRDAQGYFKIGDYARTIDLCKYHYIIVGDSAADALLKKAELCERLTKEINEITEELRSANPDDPTVTKLKPAESVLDSIHAVVIIDGGTSAEGFSDPRSSIDNESVTITEAEEVINGFQWVDLGLPSGLKWATKNIGAKHNSDFGSFVSWEENNDDTYSIMTRSFYSYSTPHTSTQKDADAATLLWGSPWRMPNSKEWDELKMFCSWKWVMMNGCAGYLVESFKNGNSIFLPACGYVVSGDRIIGRQQGYYWSSTPKKGEPQKGDCFFFSEKRIQMKTFSFSFGLCIRAVSD